MVFCSLESSGKSGSISSGFELTCRSACSFGMFLSQVGATMGYGSQRLGSQKQVVARCAAQMGREALPSDVFLASWPKQRVNEPSCSANCNSALSLDLGSSCCRRISLHAGVRAFWQLGIRRLASWYCDDMMFISSSGFEVPKST